MLSHQKNELNQTSVGGASRKQPAACKTEDVEAACA